MLHTLLNIRLLTAGMIAAALIPPAHADQTLLKTHCARCHGGAQPKGDFAIASLGDQPNSESIDRWISSLEYVRAEDMPPAGESRLSPDDRRRLTAFLASAIRTYESAAKPVRLRPRRLNNRELANSLADVLLIEDVGTHEPLANLLADTLKDGFDTNGDALGLSEFHLEQYINAFRRIVDATVLSHDRPETRRIVVGSRHLRVADDSNRRRAEQLNRTAESIEILDMRKHVYFSNFESVPSSGRYRIVIRAMGVDRTVYAADRTGHYHGDPIRLRVHLGDRIRDFELRDGEAADFEIDEWLAAGTRIRISYPTDGLRLEGNGNFKFQYRIAHDYLKEHNPTLYNRVVTQEVPKARRRSDNPAHWVHWTGYWQGPRPRLFGAVVEGPFYESWPPARHQRLVAANSKAADAATTLLPIARRAWRREAVTSELKPIVRMVQSRAESIGDLQAMKEGIVAILASPSFLLVNRTTATPDDRFATRLSLFLTGSASSSELRSAVAAGRLRTFEAVHAEVRRQLEHGRADEFSQQFPQAWLQLQRINFMAPDPDRFPMYDRKRLSEDMIGEVVHFFGHALENNVPIPKLLTADYSFVNADLAKVYGLPDVPQDSKFRKYTFRDGRRGGFLGMGAFLALTADSLGTSPIHRAVYVMENFMGIHPDPPPGDVEIAEPDVRQARTIKEILSAHRADQRCASCHRTIDPYGYAFENFDPVGAWRQEYTAHLDTTKRSRRARRSQPGIPIDAAATFRNGSSYKDIREFRALMNSDANRERFVRCFVTKLLMYATGEEPTEWTEVDRIVSMSAAHDYRIIETISAVIDSPLFRDR